MLRIGRRNDIATDWPTDGLTTCYRRAKEREQLFSAGLTGGGKMAKDGGVGGGRVELPARSWMVPPCSRRLLALMRQPGDVGVAVLHVVLDAPSETLQYSPSARHAAHNQGLY